MNIKRFISIYRDTIGYLCDFACNNFDEREITDGGKFVIKHLCNDKEWRNTSDKDISVLTFTMPEKEAKIFFDDIGCLLNIYITEQLKIGEMKAKTESPIFIGFDLLVFKNNNAEVKIQYDVRLAKKIFTKDFYIFLNEYDLWETLCSRYELI